MQKLIAAIFLFIFSFQVVPVKEIGGVLYKQLITEEVPDAKTATDEQVPGKLKVAIDVFVLSESAYSNSNRYFGSSILILLHKAEAFPVFHIPDIFTPPPDLV